MTEQLRYEENILLSVRKIMRAIDMHSSNLARDFGLTSPQLICLKKLKEKGGMSPGGLAKAIHLSHATVTGIISRLEKKGLVLKSRSTEDGRSFLISITDAGEAMLESSPSVLQDQFMKELSKLRDWEKTMILSALQRITSILDVESLEVAPVMTTGPVEAAAEKITELLSSSAHDLQENNESESCSSKENDSGR